MAITSGILAAASAGFQYAGVQKQNQAQRKAAKIERRISEIENVRRARRAVAERRIQSAQITAAAESGGLEGSSAVKGAVGSLATQTAANIGAASTLQAAAFNQSRTVRKGAEAYARLGSIADTFAGASAVASTFARVPTLNSDELSRVPKGVKYPVRATN